MKKKKKKKKRFFCASIVIDLAKGTYKRRGGVQLLCKPEGKHRKQNRKNACM